MSKYHRIIHRNKEGKSDVYDILRAYDITDPSHQHAVKKLLAPGQRSGGKGIVQDIEEAIWSLNCFLDHLRLTAVPKEDWMSREGRLAQHGDTPKESPPTVAPEIPEGVWYSAFSGCFYSVITRNKLSPDFTDRWINHCEAFPQADPFRGWVYFNSDLNRLLWTKGALKVERTTRSDRWRVMTDSWTDATWAEVLEYVK